MILQIKEGEISWLPGITQSDIPNSLPPGLTIRLKSGILGLEVNGVVGAISLSNGDTIQILPKIGRINFLRLLFKAEGNQTALESEFNSFVEYQIEEVQSIDSIVARQLFICLDEILRRSAIQDRIKIKKEEEFALGKIDVLRTIVNINSKKGKPVVSSFKKRTFNTAENRLLTEAAIRSWPFLDHELQNRFEPIYNFWLRRFSFSEDVWSDLLTIEKYFSHTGYGGSRDYYRKALMLAKIILGSSGIGFGNEKPITGDSILINTADIFEKYLRSIISHAYTKRGYIVSKGGSGTQSLYTDGSFKLIPDIVISKDNHTILIADAKYKAPTANDHYQMVAYLAAYKLKRGLILAPLFTGEKLIVKEYSTPARVIVRELYLPMGDLNITEEVLSSLIEHFIY